MVALGRGGGSYERGTPVGVTMGLATCAGARKVYVRLPGKGNSNSQGARPVDLIITMIKWIRTSRLSIKNSLSVQVLGTEGLRGLYRGSAATLVRSRTPSERELFIGNLLVRIHLSS